MTERKRVFILAKTYPTISKQYAELVCTAGILEDGTWIRLYPVPFRLLDDDKKYPKYSWINVNVTRNLSDFRIESYRPEIESIVVEPEIPKIRGIVDWETRRHIIFHKQKIYKNLQELISEAKDTKKSLAVFKPSEIKALRVEKRENGWSEENLKSLKAQARQLNFFKTKEELEEELKPAQKISYAFKYVFVDNAEQEASLMIEDWELGSLYLKYNNEEEAKQAVIDKYFNNFAKTKDVYFFLGTTKKWHNVSPNPFVIIGVFYPPFSHNERQLTLGF